MYKKIGILVLFSLFMPLTSLAWDGYPYDLVGNTYSEECNLYINTGSDELCDHSQLALKNRDQSENIAVEAGLKPETEQEHEDSKLELIFSALMILVFLLIIIGYVQYKKKYD